MNCTAFLHSDSCPPAPSPQHFPVSRRPAPTPARPTRRPAPSSRLSANVPPARDIRVQRPHDLRRGERRLCPRRPEFSPASRRVVRRIAHSRGRGVDLAERAGLKGLLRSWLWQREVFVLGAHAIL